MGYLFRFFSSNWNPNFKIDMSITVIFTGFIAKFGAGLFLLIQVIILLDFTHSWNDAWVEKDEQKWYAEFLAS